MAIFRSVYAVYPCNNNGCIFLRIHWHKLDTVYTPFDTFLREITHSHHQQYSYLCPNRHEREQGCCSYIRIMTATESFHFHSAVFYQMPENMCPRLSENAVQCFMLQNDKIYVINVHSPNKGKLTCMKFKISSLNLTKLLFFYFTAWTNDHAFMYSSNHGGRSCVWCLMAWSDTAVIL